ncbi:MAG: 4Fe-4S dicluster domain-containing protein [Coriobacteriales bacterium]|nr:4Fe-4S dicluster domain-containing protein [Coriobacteriales bacterium]
MSLGFYVDMERCIGCRTCQVACKDRHNLQVAGPRPRRVDSFESGTYPEVGMFHVVMSCNHCENPACTAACPTGAMYKSADGTVLHDDEKCIRCQACVMACPYGAPQYVKIDDLILKCDACGALRVAGKNPTCVDACPMRALDFGEMDELVQKYGEGLVSELPCIEPAATTNPNLLIKASPAALSEEFNAIVL